MRHSPVVIVLGLICLLVSCGDSAPDDDVHSDATADSSEMSDTDTDLTSDTSDIVQDLPETDADELDSDTDSSPDGSDVGDCETDPAREGLINVRLDPVSVPLEVDAIVLQKTPECRFPAFQNVVYNDANGDPASSPVNEAFGEPDAVIPDGEGGWTLDPDGGTVPVEVGGFLVLAFPKGVDVGDTIVVYEASSIEGEPVEFEVSFGYSAVVMGPEFAQGRLIGEGPVFVSPPVDQ